MEITSEVDGVSVISDEFLPFLDMKMSWDAKGKLRFSVFQKPNQRLKYVSADSTHTPATRKAIPRGVFQRLAKITSKLKELKSSPINWIYLEHAAELTTAGLKPRVWPTMDQL